MPPGSHGPTFLRVIRIAFVCAAALSAIAGCGRERSADPAPVAVVEAGEPAIEPDNEPPSLPADARADRMVVVKSQRVLRLMTGGVVIREYRVALGSNPVGDKRCQGDRRTPEGEYVLDYRNPNSRFHKAIHVSYPDDRDRKEAADAGCPPGGDIMIHGLPSGLGAIGGLHRLRDWTEGCIAVTNREMDEIWRVVPDGTPVAILP